MDVTRWLTELGLNDYASSFQDNGVDASLLPELTNEDLKDLGVARLADRKRLLKAIVALSENTSIQSTQSVAPPLTEQGERRHVTILFADLAGFTNLSTHLDPEDLHQLLSRFYEAVDTIIETYGGTVDKHLGDGIMALFGAPIAHGDDPIRAVRAAFDIHQAMEQFSVKEGRRLSVHIGIAMGKVIAGGLGRDGHKEYTVIGDSVNLASRLDALAESGETMIDEAVHTSTCDHIHCSPYGKANIKGLDTPINVWKATGLKTEHSLYAATRFVGRKSELRQLEGILTSCKEDRNGHLILLRGEAGIGKSRLLTQFMDKCVQHQFQTHASLILDFGIGKGQATITSLLLELLKLLGETPSPNSHASIAANYLSQDEQPFLRDLLGYPQATTNDLYTTLDDTQRQHGKKHVIETLMKAVAQQTPFVWIVEDIHWADDETLEHLSILANAIHELPVIIAMSSRIAGNPADGVWRAQIANCALLTITVGPLRAHEAEELAQSFMDIRQSHTRAFIEKAEGNPLYLEQLFRNATESGEEQIPPSIQSLILARVDHLPSRDKLALQAAAIFGQRFRSEAIAHLLNDTSYSMDALLAQQLIRPIDDEYLFAHALIQQSVYDSLLNKRRVELHTKAAEYFASHDITLKAEHLGRAGSPEAPQSYLEAAQFLSSLFHHDAALRTLESALEMPLSPELAFALMFAKARAHYDLGQIEQAIDCFHQAEPHAQTPNDTCHVWLELARCLRVADKHVQALDALGKAETHTSSETMVELRADIHHMRGNIYFPMGKIEDCTTEHAKSLELAQSINSPKAEANALSGLADASYMAGKMASATHYFTQCVEVARQHGLDSIAVVNQSMIGFSRMYALEFDAAMYDALSTIEMAQNIGRQRAELLGHTLAVFIAFELADYAQAQPHIQAARQLAQQLGAPRFEAQALMYTGKRLHADGDTTKALETLLQAEKISNAIGHGFAGPRIQAAIAACQTDADQAFAILQRGEAMLHQGTVGHNPLFFYPDAIAIALRHDDHERAQHYCDGFERFNQGEHLLWSDVILAHASQALGQTNMPMPNLSQDLVDVTHRWERLRLLVPSGADK